MEKTQIKQRDMSKQVRHLIFSGGGIKGLSYIGCFKALEEMKIIDDLESCSGCSIGAVISMLIVLGYTGEELYDFILHFDYNDIRDLNFIQALSNYGLETGERVLCFLGAMIKRKTGNKQTTFAELYQHNPIRLTINATNLHTYKVAYFDYERTPDMPVLLALRMSISVPFLIKPVSHEHQFYVDGGLLDNLPISQAPDSEETVAFDLEPISDLGSSWHINSLESYIYHVFGCIYTEINQIRMANVKKMRIIKIDTQDINSFSINLTQEQRIKLFNIGYDCTHTGLSE